MIDLTKPEIVENAINRVLQISDDPHNVLTPFDLCNEILEKIPSLDGDILVVANLEFVYTIINNGVDPLRVTFATPCKIKAKVAFALGLPSKNIKIYKSIITKEDIENMEYDVVLTNPPYHGRGELYQKFFNFGVEITKPGGFIIMVHPSTVYYTNKSNKSNTLLMQENIRRYETSVDLRNPREIWKTDNAEFGTDVAITCLQKIPSDVEITNIKYANGKEYTNCNLVGVSMTNIDPLLMEKIYRKYMKCISKNGSLLDAKTTDPDTYKAGLPKICGNQGLSNFFSFFAPRIEYATDGNFGIDATNSHGNPDNRKRQNIYHYCKTDFARFGLALFKCSSNLASGELGSVPLVDFNRKHTNQELFEEAGINKKEQKIISKFLENFIHE